MNFVDAILIELSDFSKFLGIFGGLYFACFIDAADLYAHRCLFFIFSVVVSGCCLFRLLHPRGEDTVLRYCTLYRTVTPALVHTVQW